MAGLTSTGLSIKRLQEVRDDISSNLRAFFGEDINTTEDSVFGQIRDSVAPGESSLWEQVQIVYDSQAPSRAEGQQLDDNAAIVGVFRLANLPSTVNASISGVNNTLLPTGFTVAVNTTKDEFVIVAPKSITSSATTKTVISVDIIADTTLYRVTIDGVFADFTSDASATEAEIVAGLISAIPTAVPSVTAVATVNTNEILISSTDGLDEKDITVDTNMSFVTVTTLIPMQSSVNGPIVAPIDQLVDIKTPIAGINSSTNKQIATLGVFHQQFDGHKLFTERHLVFHNHLVGIDRRIGRRHAEFGWRQQELVKEVFDMRACFVDRFLVGFRHIKRQGPAELLGLALITIFRAFLRIGIEVADNVLDRAEGHQHRVSAVWVGCPILCLGGTLRRYPHWRMRLLIGAWPQIHILEAIVFAFKRGRSRLCPGLYYQIMRFVETRQRLAGVDHVGMVFAANAADESGDQPAGGDVVDHGVFFGDRQGVLGQRQGPAENADLGVFGSPR